MTRTCACGRPTANTLCRACTNDLRQLLARVRDLAHDLQVTLARQDRIAAPSRGGKGHDRPLPFNAGASDAQQLLRDTLTAWVRQLDPARAGLTLNGAAVYLQAHLPALVVRDDADAALDELRHAVEHADRAIDLHVHRLFVGVCGCGADLHAEVDQPVAVCDRCGTSHDALAGRQAIVDTSTTRDLTIDALVRLAPAYGLAVTRDQVKSYARRGRLAVRGTNDQGRNLYRVGDLLDLLAERRAVRRPERRTA